MPWYLRLILLIVFVGAAMYLMAGVHQLLRDGILWLLMSYVVIGSVTGGVRRVVAAFAGRSIYFRRSALGYSWYALTMWFLRKILGLRPAERPGGRDE